jgi:hypothetical protein
MASFKKIKHEKKTLKMCMTTFLFKPHFELKLNLIQGLDEED